MLAEQNSSRPKKVMTTEMLRNLELAREKARQKRKEQGELSRLKKELEEKTKAEQIQELKAKLGKEKPTEPETDDEETETPVKKKKKTKKPIVIVEESESDSEDEQVVYIKRKSTKKKVVEEDLPEVPREPPRGPDHFVTDMPVEPPQQVYRSPYQGLHPSMLLHRRR